MRRTTGPVLRFVTVDDGKVYFQVPGHPTRKYKNPSHEIIEAAAKVTRAEAEDNGWLAPRNNKEKA